MRILLIEDDTATADYVAKGLREMGNIVQVARTGRDGMLLAAGACAGGAARIRRTHTRRSAPPAPGDPFVLVV